MSGSRIVILSDQLLLAQGVRHLIESNMNAQVFALETHAEDTLTRIRDLAPEVVLLGDKTNAPNSFVVALLDAVPNVRIIRLSMEENVIHIYDGHQVTAQSGQDLLNVLNSLTKPMILSGTGIGGKEVLG